VAQGGAPKTFELDIVIHGWRGSAIDRGIGAYAAEEGWLDLVPRVPSVKR
jgi:hypothetical protein